MLRVVTKWQIVVALLSFACAGVVQGRSRAAANAEDALTLARIIVSEAGPTPGRESWAILYVLEWRRTHLPALAGLSLTQMGLRYATEFNGRIESARARLSRSLTRDQIPDAIERDVASWLEGRREPNPCRGAVHWAARGRRSWSHLQVHCEVPVHNDYFRRSPD